MVPWPPVRGEKEMQFSIGKAVFRHAARTGNENSRGIHKLLINANKGTRNARTDWGCCQPERAGGIFEPCEELLNRE